MSRTSKEILRLFDVFNRSKLLEFCSRQGVTWDIAPPHHHEYQGLVEVIMKPIKRALLSRFLYTPSYTELFTIALAIEQYLNLRAIGGVTSSSTDSIETVTPIEMMCGTKPQTMPAYTTNKDYTVADLPTTRSLIIRRALMEKSLSQAWSIWQSSYIESLNSVPSNTSKRGIPRVGQLFLIDAKEMNSRRGKVVVGVVTKIHSRSVHPTKFEEIRSVTLRYQKEGKNYFVTKSLFKIAPLEIDLFNNLYAD